jgi:hypothetical protein
LINYSAASCEVSRFRDFIDFVEASDEEYNPKRFKKHFSKSLPVSGGRTPGWEVYRNLRCWRDAKRIDAGTQTNGGLRKPK